MYLNELPELDFHGHQQLDSWQIEQMLEEFILTCKANKENKIRIITGKGKKVKPQVLWLLKHRLNIKKIEFDNEGFNKGAIICALN